MARIRAPGQRRNSIPRHESHAIIEAARRVDPGVGAAAKLDSPGAIDADAPDRAAEALIRPVHRR